MRSYLFFNKLIVLGLFFSTINSVYSQRPQQRPEKVILTGKVVSTVNKEPLEYATITLKNERRPNVLQGGITAPDGSFSFEVFPGKYDINIEYISFKTITQKDIIIRSNTNLGTINLELEAENLDEVELVGEKTTVEVRLDKRIYNVGKDIVVRGGNVSDVLDNVPSVSVDVEGVVSLRGNDNVRILINGKPSGLVGISGSEGLRQLPAESIEKVEVITSPSARYDASGTAGILNIILKKENLKGFNGSIMLNAGIPRNFSGSTSINWRTNKVNFFNTITIRDSKSLGNGLFNSEYFNAPNPNSYVNESRKYDRSRKNVFLNLGAEYYINDKSSLIVSGFYRKSNNGNIGNTIIDELDISRVVSSTNTRIDNEVEFDETKQVRINYTKKFNDDGHELTAEFQYETSIEDEDSEIKSSIPEEVYTDESQKRILYQADYVWPIDKNTQFELGYRGDFRTQNLDYNVFIANNNMLFKNTDLSNFLIYTENVNAAYTQFGKKINKLSYLLGLRMEHSNIIVNQVTTSNKNTKNYINWFPTINISYEVNETESYNIGFSRRIRRPRARSLNPFPSRTSITFFRQGNPDLNPSYSQSFDFGYLKRWSKFTFNGSVYYQISTQNIERITEDTGVIVRISENPVVEVPAIRSTTVNLSKNIRTGTEFTLTYSPSRKLRLSGNFNIFNSETIGSYNGTDFGAKIVSWFSRVNANVKLPWDMDLQLRGFYRGPRANAQTSTKGIFTLSGALNKTILNKKGSISLRASDIFNSRRRKSTTISNGFTTYSEFQWRQPSYTLTFTYKINENKANKRKSTNGNNGGGDNDEFDF